MINNVYNTYLSHNVGLLLALFKMDTHTLKGYIFTMLGHEKLSWNQEYFTLFIYLNIMYVLCIPYDSNTHALCSVQT